MISRPNGMRRRLLVALLEHGPVRDTSGRATMLLADSMGYESRPVSLSPLMLSLEEDGLITRDVRGRRCFEIAITPKGRAMIELDIGMETRARPAPTDPSSTRDDSGAESRSDSGTVDADVDVGSALQLMRADLREMLMEMGALRRRVSELERRIHASGSDVRSGDVREHRAG